MPNQDSLNTSSDNAVTLDNLNAAIGVVRPAIENIVKVGGNAWSGEHRRCCYVSAI